MELGATSTSILGSLGGIAGTVGKLLAEGVTAAELAEKVVSILDPALKPDIDALITVLQEVQKLVGEV